MKFLLIMLVVTGSASSSCDAQQFDPFNGSADKFRADLTLFFKGPAAEHASKMALLDSVKHFESKKQWTVRNLRNRLDDYEVLLKQLQRHYQYYRLSSQKNNIDTFARKELRSFASAIDILDAHVDSILQQPVFRSLNLADLKANNLSIYRYLLELEKARAAHLLSPYDEKLADLLTGNLLDQLTRRYDNLIDTIKGISIQVAGKSYYAVTDHAAMMKDRNSNVRKSGQELFLRSYSNYGELFAATLIDITTEKNALAVAHGYKDAPEELYASRLQLSEDSVRLLLEKVKANSNVLKEYQELQRQKLRQSLNVDSVHSWDASVAAADNWQPVSISELQSLVIEALAPLGAVYQQYFEKLLDPRNGRLDIAGGPHRAKAGNSFGYTGSPIGLYMTGYNGDYRSVFTLIHEGGHAVHRQLMSDNHIIPSYFSGPNFLFESFALFNELLLLDELEKRAKTPDGKAYFTRAFLDKLSFEIFTSAEEGLFEQTLYDGVAAGKLRGFEDINDMYRSVMWNYDIYFDGEAERGPNGS